MKGIQTMIRIITDSAADFTPEELKSLRLTCCPMQITFGVDSYEDGVELSAETFWKRIMSGENPKTSQPSPDVFLTAFEEAAAAGDEVICILISSALSGTVQSALLAKGMADGVKVHVVDSLLAATAEKLLVLYACRLRDEGRLTAAQIAQKLESYKTRVRICVSLDTLDYLARGGRIPKAAASLGSMVQLKPLVSITESGHLEMVGKGLGSHRAAQALLTHIGKFDIDENEPCWPVYTYSTANAESFVKKLNQHGIACSMDDAAPIGATVATHTGPGTYGLVFVAKA